ncbi:MAG: hypothetical protein LBN42_00325 [Oscillospiraceae bacterium]|jgi:hypothetical protein|nr:hypothetical protein [Oscillospiraceae bacterium]
MADKREGSGLFPRLADDFFEGVWSRDYNQLNESVTSLESFIRDGTISGDEAAEYFNLTYNGRSVYNSSLNTSDYPPESIMRELFQNIFDCRYPEEGLKAAVEFRADGYVSIAYNEIGFNLEQLLRFLSFGHSGNISGDGDYYGKREGRFGLGAKSVFVNTESVCLRSRTFRIKIENDHGHINIRSLEFTSQDFIGTEIMFKPDPVRYDKIKENFSTLCDRKGEFLNIPELCFAYSNKSYLKTAIISVNDGKSKTLYRIDRNQDNASDKKRDKLRFFKDGAPVIEFIRYQSGVLSFLIPYAVSRKFKDGVHALIFAKYNYFSTFELTGDGDDGHSFFISVPNYYVTPFRTSVRRDCEAELKRGIEEGIKKFITEYSDGLIIDVTPVNQTDKNGFYPSVLRPATYIFGCLRAYINSSLQDAKLFFRNAVSIRLPNEQEIEYAEFLKYSYAGAAEGVSIDSHKDASAYQEYIAKELAMQERLLADLTVKTLSAEYSYSDENGNTHKFYEMRIYRQDKKYVVDSRHNPEIDAEDNFGISEGFHGIASKGLFDIFGGIYPIASFEPERNSIVLEPRVPKLRNSEQLVKIFALFDSLYGAHYFLGLTYNCLIFRRGIKSYVFETAKIQATSLKAAAEAVIAHTAQFDYPETSREILRTLLAAYSENKTVSEFLRCALSESCPVTAAEDINGHGCFELYGFQYFVPDGEEILPPETKRYKEPDPAPALRAWIPYYKTKLPHITKTEFNAMRAFVSKMDDPENAYPYIANFSDRLRGYGAECPLCERTMKYLPGFRVKSFVVPRPNSGISGGFNFSLFMCADDAAHSEFWDLHSVTIGGMKPMDWLEEISVVTNELCTDDDGLPPEFLICRFAITFSETYIGDYSNTADYDPDTAYEPDNIRSFDAEIYLTPLLAARIFNDNAHLLQAEFDSKYIGEAYSEN